MANPGTSGATITALRWLARTVYLLFAAFWIFFNVASGIGEIGELGVMALIMHLVMPLLILITLYFVWREELVGGIAVLAQAAIFVYFFNLWDVTELTFLTIPVPLMLVGVLLIVCWADGRFSRRAAA
jgi:hypothetical protein